MKLRPLHAPVVVKPIEDGEKIEDGMFASEKSRRDDIIVVDWSYIRAEALEALKTFFAPFSGLYAAAFGPISKRTEPPTTQMTRGD
jgi:hypothetical protein